jgi:glycosyltransferase involved in cell wall biosynthesis
MPTNKDSVLVSILILSIPSRIEKYLIPLYNKMLEQTKNYPEVEILCLIDNKSMTIGEKRQSLLDSARGKWIAFMDDDDDITDDYMSTIINTIKEKPADVISFDQHCIVNGNQFIVNFNMSNPNERYVPGMTHVKRPPFHMCFWKSDIAKQAKLEVSSYGEDFAWCLLMYPKVKSETHINKILHLYRYDDRTSESIQFMKK